jgi:hypothetical protein
LVDQLESNMAPAVAASMLFEHCKTSLVLLKTANYRATDAARDSAMLEERVARGYE